MIGVSQSFEMLFALLPLLATSSSASLYPSSACKTTPYVCGLEYFPALNDAMEKATTEIIFTGWKFDLDAPLLGADKNVTFLGAVEKAVARGVQVYVLMWKNTISGPADRWKIMGFHVQQVAAELKRVGARVLLDNGHPHSLLEKVQPNMRWCQHIKAVVLDQQRVFVTGLDIANERVDSCDHKWPDPRRVTNPESETGFHEFWQDSAVLAEGKVAHDVADVFVRRWEASCSLAPDSFSDCKDMPVLRQPTFVEGTQRCGVRLSATPYFLDVPSTVHEIEDEYISAILEAKRSVVIENLYLSSELLGEKGVLDKLITSSSHNGILRAIWSRLKRAVDEGQVDGSFSVVIILPAATEEAFTQSINIESIWSEERGLVPTLQRYLSSKGHNNEVWASMLRVFCLGKAYNIDDMGWNFMTIYIHAKVLLVDGNVAVVGSANLNDRSMLGTGDAELDLRIDGDFALSLQRRLLSYHAPSGYDENRLAASLGKVADENWNKLEAVWPEMFNPARRSWLPIFGSKDVAKVTFGMFVPKHAKSLTPPALDGMLLPFREDLWGKPSKFGTWEHPIDKLPWLGDALRLRSGVKQSQDTAEPLLINV
jgi:phosphatidylserine/phosphatidylglycerophosphate/cardiolipin synthase-like enzyme